jgi:hypothetical protein
MWRNLLQKFRSLVSKLKWKKAQASEPKEDAEKKLCPRCGINQIDPVLLGTENEGHICGQCWTQDRQKDEQPEQPEQPEFKPNRATRRGMSKEARIYERRRRKFDRFVVPQGTPPTPIERIGNPKPKVKQPELQYTDDGDHFSIADKYLVDKHHSDRKTEVLYDPHELFGEFNFRDTVLDQLERYYVYLERMRRHDKGAYEFYTHVGAMLLPYLAVPDTWDPEKEHPKSEYRKFAEPSSWFLRHRPAFGCVAYGTSPEIEKIERGEYRKDPQKDKYRTWIPKFMYFVKYQDHEAPPEVQPKNGGDVYKMTVWWDKPEEKKMKYGVPEEYPIFVSADGKVEILRTISTEMFPIYSKKYGLNHIPQRAWKLPHHADDWAKLHHTSSRKLLNNLFCGLVEHLEYAAFSMVRVSVINKKGQHALFSLDPRRMSYFFQDRDYQLTEHGVRKKVFHMVRPHVRSDGTVTKLHFRGVREFTWAGYLVKITVPGKDHAMMEEMDVGVTDEFWAKKMDKDDIVGEGEIGRYMRSIIDGKPLKTEELKTFKPKSN